MYASDGEKSPGRKLLFAILIGLALVIPIFSVWLLVYDRQSQSEAAAASITEGWGGAQAMRLSTTKPSQLGPTIG